MTHTVSVGNPHLYYNPTERSIQMTKLSCDVSTCTYHCDHHCTRDSVLIDGRRATCREQTCCASFSAKLQNATNSTSCQKPKVAADISCKASRCMYNADGLCNAKEIQIATFGCCDPCSADETACTAFKTTH